MSPGDEASSRQGRSRIEAGGSASSLFFCSLSDGRRNEGKGASLLWGSTIESAEPVDVFCGLDWMVDRLIEGVVRSIQAPRHGLRHAHTRSKENLQGGQGQVGVIEGASAPSLLLCVGFHAPSA